MTYFHINDLLTEPRKILTKEEYERYFKEPGTPVNRFKRYIKSTLGTGQAYPKLEKLIKTNDFLNLDKADEVIDWNNAPHIIL